jgi:hypothetical protein
MPANSFTGRTDQQRDVGARAGAQRVLDRRGVQVLIDDGTEPEPAADRAHDGDQVVCGRPLQGLEPSALRCDQVGL